MNRTAESRNRLYLVSCVAGKRHRPAPAKDLYRSAWFRFARAYVERDEAPWYILSAKYGLVHPDTVIEPYEESLNVMTAAQRRAWASGVVRAMQSERLAADECIVFAGQRYREDLVQHLRSRFGSVIVPMEGLAIGKQLRWLKNGQNRGPL